MKAILHARFVLQSPVILALFLIGFGLLTVATPLFAADDIVPFVSRLITFSGVVELVYACSVENDRSSLRQMVFGSGLYLGAGLWLQTTRKSDLTELLLALLLFFIVEGLINTMAFLSSSKRRGSFWVLLDGLITIALAMMIWTGWPTSPTWAMGILVGVRLSTAGAIRLLLALAQGRHGLLTSADSDEQTANTSFLVCRSG